MTLNIKTFTKELPSSIIKLKKSNKQFYKLDTCQKIENNFDQFRQDRKNNKSKCSTNQKSQFQQITQHTVYRIRTINIEIYRYSKKKIQDSQHKDIYQRITIINYQTQKKQQIILQVDTCQKIENNFDQFRQQRKNNKNKYSTQKSQLQQITKHTVYRIRTINIKIYKYSKKKNPKIQLRIKPKKPLLSQINNQQNKLYLPHNKSIYKADKNRYQQQIFCTHFKRSQKISTSIIQNTLPKNKHKLIKILNLQKKDQHTSMNIFKIPWICGNYKFFSLLDPEYKVTVSTFQTKPQKFNKTKNSKKYRCATLVKKQLVLRKFSEHEQSIKLYEAQI
eukprot:TRINITY_DN7013_c0_g1_i8.p1 TRINITY_DN7013_c0_g1~~TRINITY_DN7013_c0_g1_i8.p1  ORF type:complete len:334 (-),score=-12.01 TRINITY_DN7013_c0_g1_i8:279-1280(-)